MDRIANRIDESGLISPIIFTADDHFIVDGNTRTEVLKRLDDDREEDYSQLNILGEFDNYVYAIPDHDLDLDPEEASAEINLFRENLSQADRATFLGYLINERVIQNTEYNYVAGDVNDLEPTKLLADLEIDGKLEEEWDDGASVRSHLEELLDELDFDSPQNARNYLTEYRKAPEIVRNYWSLEELSFSHVEELNNVNQQLEDESDLANSDVVDDGHDQFEDLVEHSREDEYRWDDSKIYYTRDDLRDLVDELEKLATEPKTDKDLIADDGPDEPESQEGPDTPEQESEERSLDDVSASEVEQLKEKLTDKERTWAKEIAEYGQSDGGRIDADLETILKNCVLEGEDYPDVLENAYQELEEIQKGLESVEEQRTDFGSYDWKNSMAERDDDLHKAVPIETDHLHAFFHDSSEMGNEIEKNSVDLFVFSPPYFTQRDTIPAEVWHEDMNPEEDTITSHEELDNAYDDFLDAMREVFRSILEHTAPGGHIIMVVSDSQAGYEGASRKPRYDVPADLSTVMRSFNEGGVDEDDRVHYENTIIWNKPNPVNSLARHFAGSKKPTQFRPNDSTERILVFRKGPKRSGDFAYEDEDDKFRPYYNTSAWDIEPKKTKDHPAPYPAKLAGMLIQAYTEPGDTVGDPMLGSGTTFEALRAINHESDHAPRKGVGWESFASEEYYGINYWDTIYGAFVPDPDIDPAGADVGSGLVTFNLPRWYNDEDMDVIE
jgi:DNA modification methylase